MKNISPIIFGTFLALQWCGQQAKEDYGIGITAVGLAQNGSHVKALALIRWWEVQCSVHFPELPINSRIIDNITPFQQTDANNPLWREWSQASVRNSRDNKYTLVFDGNNRKVARIINNDGNGTHQFRTWEEHNTFLGKCQDMKK